MKKIMYLLYGAFLVMNTGCGNDPFNLKKGSVVRELSIDGEEKVIKIESGGNDSGIGIEFCLVNEQGIPATIFQEGETFSFRLTIINNVKSLDSMYMPLGLGYGYIPDNFYVMSEKGDTIGRPFYFKGTEFVSIPCPVIKRSERYVFEIPWDERRDSWYVCTLNAHGMKNDVLPRGIYYTSFTHTFCLKAFSLSLPDRENDIICTNPITFKINFEIR